jgi:1-acyl-sn-glycerol-3-phosphate acyltransferase
MGGWRELSFLPAQLLDIYRRMEVPALKQHAGPNIGFEDLRKEAVMAGVLVAQTFFRQIGLRVKYRGLERLRGRRLVFVANHQGGNLDALVLASILYVEKEQVPLIPTSDRLLEDKFVGQLNQYLKYIGPFFIRSSFKDDPDYMAEVSRFLEALLDAKQYLLFFPEGYTSKHGKPCPFRRGLVKSLLGGGPVTFCPISLTYESPLNDSGVKSEAFSPLSVVQGLMARKVGTVYVNFGECLDADNSTNHHTLTTRIIHSICSEIPILTVDLVATILLDHGSCTLEQLAREVQWLEGHVRDQRLPYIGRDLHKALPAIQHLVRIEGNTITATNAVALHFYRNRLLPLFFELAQPSPLLRNECIWSVTHLHQDERLKALATRIMSPLVEIYGTVLQSLAQGTRSVAALRKLTDASPATSCYTLRNLLQLLETQGVVKVAGDVIVT